ncbi:MAG: nuclear transport factor 2 family protein [Bacteroidia bacterium]|nr:nuclear transport factor 2 family protein [Bacteroidia bacterium]
MNRKNLFRLFLLALTGLLSCNPPAQDNSAADANVAIVKQNFAHFNAHDWTKMASMYAEKAEFKDPGLGTEIVTQTRKQIIEKYTGLQSEIPDVHDEILTIYPSGNQHVIVEFVSTGTAPDSSRFKLPICTIFTLENGLITKDFTYYDNFEAPEVQK